MIKKLLKKIEIDMLLVGFIAVGVIVMMIISGIESVSHIN
jgi:hypothetical protein